MKAANYKGEDQAAWKRRLTCTFVVHMLKAHFLVTQLLCQAHDSRSKAFRLISMFSVKCLQFTCEKQKTEEPLSSVMQTCAEEATRTVLTV